MHISEAGPEPLPLLYDIGPTYFTLTAYIAVQMLHDEHVARQKCIQMGGEKIWQSR